MTRLHSAHLRTLVRAAVALVAGALLFSTAPSAIAANHADFAVGLNAEQQACRGLWRFKGAGEPQDIDVYCAAWERPSGSLHLAQDTDNAARDAFFRDCAGDPRPMAISGPDKLQQVACRRGADEPAARYGLILSHNGRSVYGAMFPADWGPSLQAARVLIGLDKPSQAQSTDPSSPGLAEIRAAFPAGPPGAAAVASYQLLRLRAYEENIVWNFDAAERDFSDLLLLHRKVRPDDISGEGEILAEIAVNLAAAGRIQESQATMDQAEAAAIRAQDTLLQSKILNYRALGDLGRHDWANALKVAAAANTVRVQMTQAASETDGTVRITREQSAQIEREAPQTHPRTLVSRAGETSPTEKREVLSAQADYISAVALRALHRPGVDTALASADAHLANVDTPPGWLAASIIEERARAAIDGHDPQRAVTLCQDGLKVLRTLAPKSRNEGHLLFVLADAQGALGRRDDAIRTGRDATAIYAAQNEAPGFPANVAASHLQRLLDAWTASQDTALADEYFETLSLVWDGTAARAMAQLAARLGEQDGSGAVRAYQDASRRYRAALARRERVAADKDPTPEAIAAVDRDVAQTSRELSRSEDAVRAQTPRYLELLNPRTASTALRRSLAAKEGYARLVLSDDRGFGALATSDGVRPFAITLRRSEAERLVTRVRDSVKPHGRRLPDFDIDAANKLYKALFGPVAANLQTIDTLHVDTGPVLSSLPFAALVVTRPDAATAQRISATHDYRGVDWLARRQSIDVALGSTAFLRVRTTPRAVSQSPVVAYGGFEPDPTGVAARLVKLGRISQSCEAAVASTLNRLPALPETLDEVKTVAATISPRGRIVTGSAFTDTAVLTDKDAGKSEVLIIATHGILGMTDCLDEPALLTSLGKDGRGLIEASRMLDRALEARLVILSACDTAGGGRADTAVSGMVGGGEALSGLSRSFIYAGAANVLASQWPVSDRAARLETQDLIAAARAGDPLVKGLAKAQTDLFDHAETAHPFFWASFVLLGDGMTRLEARP